MTIFKNKPFELVIMSDDIFHLSSDTSKELYFLRSRRYFYFYMVSSFWIREHLYRDTQLVSILFITPYCTKLIKE